MDNKSVLALAALCLIGYGCGDKEDAEAPIKAFPHAVARAAPSVNLSAGKIDPKQVGTWTNPTDVYTFRADGSFEMSWDRMMTVRPGKQERKTGGSKGKWSISGGDIMMVSDSGVKFKLVRILTNHDNTLEMHALYVKSGPVYQRASTAPKKQSSKGP